MADRSFTWLHLSDLHFTHSDSQWGSRGDFSSLLDDLMRLQTQVNIQPDVLFVTGDLAFGSPEAMGGQYRGVRRLLRQIQQLFDRPIPNERLFLVPGNHDVDHASVPDHLAMWLETRRLGGRDGIRAINSTLARKTAEWREFSQGLHAYRGFLKHNGFGHLLDDPDRLVYVRDCEVNGLAVRVIGLNTAWAARFLLERGRLWVGAEWQARLFKHKRDHIDIAVALMHHPLEWIWLPEQEFLHQQISNACDFLFHGHNHDPRAVRSDKDVITVGSGPSYPRAGYQSRYVYGRVWPHQSRVELWSRRFHEDTWAWGPEIFPQSQSEDGRLVFHLRGLDSSSAARPSSGKVSFQRDDKESAAAREDFSPSAVVVLFDIVGLTLLNPNLQLQYTRALWSALQDHALFQSMRENSAIASGGDGVVVAFLRLDHLSRALAFAKDVCEWSKLHDDRFELRAGIHVGPVWCVDDRRSASLIVGSTVIDCASMLRAGGAGVVICSDSYVQRIAGTRGFEDLNIVPSVVGGHGFTVRGKDGRELEVRMIVIDDRCPVPESLRQAHRLRSILSDYLADVVASFGSSVEAASDRIRGISEVGTRASLVVPEEMEGERYLTETPFIYPQIETLSGLSRKAKSHYSLAGKGVGPMGRSFLLRRTIVVHDLPTPSVAWQSYLAELAEVGLRKEHVARWGRRPRALICFPFGFSDATVDEPDGVVVVDCLDSLSSISERELVRIGDSLAKQYANTIGALWRLRLQGL